MMYNRVQVVIMTRQYHDMISSQEPKATMSEWPEPGSIEAIQKDQDSIVRLLAVRALGKAGEKSKVLLHQLLQTMRQDENIGVRVEAAWVLGKLGGKQVISPLKEAMNDDRNKNWQFNFAYTLLQLEGATSEGLRIIQKSDSQGKLDYRQKRLVEETLEQQRKTKKERKSRQK